MSNEMVVVKSEKRGGWMESCWEFQGDGDAVEGDYDEGHWWEQFDGRGWRCSGE